MPSRAFSRSNRSASKHSALNRSASVLMLAVLPVALPLLAGCDNATHTADLQVESDIAAAEAKPDLAGAQTSLDTAVKNTGASTMEKLRAKALLANNQLQAAQDLARKVGEREAVISRIASDISLLVSQIQSNNARVAALKLDDPAKIQDSIKDKTAAMTGSDDKPDWIKSDAGTLDSLAANDKQAAALQQQISQLNDTIKTETDQRTSLLNDADKLSEQSEHEHGSKSVDVYTQASNNRKQAADLTVKLDQDNVLLTRAQADLALRQGQQEALKGSIKLMGDRSTTIDERWKAVQAEIDTINADSKTLAGDEAAAPQIDLSKDNADIDPDGKKLTTIAAKASALAALVKKNADQRSTAMTKYNAAIDFYRDAYALANTYKTNLTTKAQDPNKVEHDIWQQQLNWLDPTTYKYLQGDAELQRAEFVARQAADEKLRLDLQSAMKKPMEDAQLPLPTTLASEELDNAVKESQKTARGYFGAADTSNSNAGAAGAIGDLSNVEQGVTPPEVKNAAAADLIFAYYGASQLEKSANDTQKATDLLNLAKEKAQLVLGNNVFLRSLPGELTPAAAPAAGSPISPATK